MYKVELSPSRFVTDTVDLKILSKTKNPTISRPVSAAF